MPQARVRLHVPGHMLDAQPDKVPEFYRQLLAALEALCAKTEVLRRIPDDLVLPAPRGHFDFIHLGRVARPLALNLGTAYLRNYFYVDPKGVNHESSIADKVFYPGVVPDEKAHAFFAMLHRSLVVQRKSRLHQPKARQDFGSGHLAVFLQDWSDPVERATLVDSLTMVRLAIAEGGGRPVVIKPHPRNSGPETQEILQLASAYRHVRVTSGNVHDILRGAAATLSISSSLALEGMLHLVPAILFGRMDLHHCAATVASPDDWPAALDRALSTTWPYERYLLWFLRWQNIDASRPYLPKVLQRMAAQGANFSALGIKMLETDP